MASKRKLNEFVAELLIFLLFFLSIAIGKDANVLLKKKKITKNLENVIGYVYENYFQKF